MSFLIFRFSSLGKRELFTLIQLSSSCLAAVSVLCLFLTVLLVGLQCVISIS